MNEREYGRRAIIGVMVPQANPVVEPEMATLLPDGFSMLITRLQGSRTDSRSRLVNYLENIAESLNTYDIAPLDAVGYACTGSSYLVGAEHEHRVFSEMSERYGYPVISSARAIRLALQNLGATKIALLAPYPQWLHAAGEEYWKKAGLKLVSSASLAFDTNDTRNIYNTTSSMALEAFKALSWDDADAIVLSGTGMPTLRALLEIRRLTNKPVISSNLCLAWSLASAVGDVDAFYSIPNQNESLFGGWADRIAR